MDFFNCVLLCLMVAWISIHVFFYAFSQSSTRARRLPPGPKPFPIIGNLLELGNKPHISLANLSRCYGPIMAIQLGQITTVVISSSTVAKDVLRTNDQLFCNRTILDAIRVSEHSVYSVAWLPVEAKWRNLRKICNSQLFATRILDKNQANRRLKVQELIADVNNVVAKGKAVEVGRFAFKTSLNLLSRTIFSVDLADQSSETAKEFKDLVWSIMEDTGKPNLADYFPVIKRFDPMGIGRSLSNNYRKMFDIFDGLIVERLEARKAHDYVTSNDMLDTLLNISEEKCEEMDMNETKHLFLDLFTAGTDTTSSTLEWAMTELLRNPESMLKAQVELKEVIGKGKLIEESDIARLPYLQAVIKEILRLHPPAPLLIPHKAEKDIEIFGHIVPEGAQVLINAWAIGRDPGIWDNPTSFMPERFFGLDIDVTGKNFELIPFGSGRRICPGLPLAMRMLNLMLGSLINSFDDWKLEDGVLPETINMEENFGLTLQMAHPLRAIAIK